jgi:hypothetical protein
MDLLPEHITDVTRDPARARARLPPDWHRRPLERDDESPGGSSIAPALGEGPIVAALPGQESLRIRLQRLELRRHFTSIAITACTIAALLLCMVVATLFFEAMLDARLSGLVGVLFTGSTLALVIGLAYFLREVHLATRTRIEVPGA